MKSIIHEFKDIIQELEKDGIVVRDIHGTLIEDIEIRTEKDWNEVYHKEIPALIREVLREISFECKIMHLKDDVRLPEYLVELYRDGKYFGYLELEIDYDHELNEVILLLVRGYKESIPVGLIPYYHYV